MNYNGYQPKGPSKDPPAPPTSGSNISQESEGVMPTTWYHFILNDGTFHDVRCAVSFKDAIWTIAKYNGMRLEMFKKCLKGYEEDDVDGIIKLFNHFSYPSIVKIYVISSVLYE